jgi:DNA polymerase-3 subunit delta'
LFFSVFASREEVAKMKDFTEVIGQEDIIAYFQKGIEENKISHAYILSGEKGSGKHLFAQIFASTLQCEKKGINPCGVCHSCLQVEGGNQPDIKYVTHEKVSLGVDDIRTQVNEDVLIKPYSSPYKIYIIPDGEKMTEQAQNALLKTIEEPPEYAVFLLLTDNINTFLPTILSRCVTLQLKPVAANLIKKYLMEQRQVPDYVAELSAKFSQGNVGKAIRYSSSEQFTEIKKDTIHVLSHIDEMKNYEIMQFIKTMAEKKQDVNDYLDLMLLWYRDVLMFKVTQDPNGLLFADEVATIRKQAESKQYEGIEAVIQAIEKAKIRLKANVNFDTAMELMICVMKEN